MVKKLAALLFFLNVAYAHAQTIKTDVLVIGGTPSGVAAAIQSARSKVKTVLVAQGTQLCPYITGSATVTIKADRNLPSGIWGEFRGRVISHNKRIPGYDTAYNAPLKFELDTGAAILSRIADSVKGLTIQLNATFTNIVKDGDRWEATISLNGKTETIKARVVIDATENAAVITKAGATYSQYNSAEITGSPNYYRTAVAMGDTPPVGLIQTVVSGSNYPPYPLYFVPMKAVVAKGADNLLMTEKLFNFKGDMENLPAQLTLGQGAGVVAAYCAFFKTTTASLNVRAIQVDLLDFKGYLLPFTDIGADTQWRAIQQVCATGMLRGAQKTQNGATQFLFMPDSIVTTVEVKPVMLETYTRAFLWFNKEKPGKEFTLGNLLSFISELTLTDPDNLQKSIAKNWHTQYKFQTDFDLDRPITRREFAILANKFLNPFARAVDLNGRMVN